MLNLCLTYFEVQLIFGKTILKQLLKSSKSGANENNSNNQWPFTHRYDAVKAMREMESYTQSVGGYPFLYADTFMTRPEFEKMFDLTSKSS